MSKVQEVIAAPLSGEELAARYRGLCDDLRFANLPGTIELDLWGRIVMSPASYYHGLIQGADVATRGVAAYLAAGAEEVWMACSPSLTLAEALFE